MLCLQPTVPCPPGPGIHFLLTLSQLFLHQVEGVGWDQRQFLAFTAQSKISKSYTKDRVF